jgi:hypothetical protein
MEFQKNEAGWHEEFETTTGMVGQYIEHRSIILTLLARIQVGKKTGQLSASMGYTLSADHQGVIATIGSDNAIAFLHHEGTKPHIILPRTKSTLRFASHGKIVYAKIVHHPGTKPNRYLTDNLNKVIE